MVFLSNSSSAKNCQSGYSFKYFVSNSIFINNHINNFWKSTSAIGIDDKSFCTTFSISVFNGVISVNWLKVSNSLDLFLFSKFLKSFLEKSM